MLRSTRRSTSSPRLLVVLGLATLLLLLGFGTLAWAQAASGPLAAIIAPPPDATVTGRVQIVGWAVDPASPSTMQDGINPRDIQLWLGPYPDGRLLDYAQFGTPSPE